MPTISNMREVLVSLVKKSEMGKIRWDLDTERNATLPERQEKSVFVSSFVTRFPHSIIHVKFFERDGGLNCVQFAVEEVQGGILWPTAKVVLHATSGKHR